MKMTLEMYGVKYTVDEFNKDDQNIEEMIEYFVTLMLAAGYIKSGIINCMNEYSEK